MSEEAASPERRTAGWGQLPGGLALTLLSVAMLIGGFLLNRLDRIAFHPVPTRLVEALPSFTPFLPTLTFTPPPTPVPSATPSSAPSTAETTTPVTPPPIPSPCQIPAGWEMYTVRPGDTLYSLALRAGVAYVALMEANCLSTLTLYAGQRIALPARLTPTPTQEPCGPPPDWTTYIVREGDTLFSLARRFGVSQEAIRRANCLRGYTIFVGQALFVPPSPPTPARTPTPLPSATWTPLPTPSHTPPPAETSTFTPSPSSTPSPTPTEFPTASPTPTPTEFPTPTDTPTPTPTDSPTPTPTPTFTITPFPTPTFTPSPTETPAEA